MLCNGHLADHVEFEKKMKSAKVFQNQVSWMVSWCMLQGTRNFVFHGIKQVFHMINKGQIHTTKFQKIIKVFWHYLEFISTILLSFGVHTLELMPSL